MAKPLEILIKVDNYDADSVFSIPCDGVRIQNVTKEADTSATNRLQNEIPDATVDQALALPGTTINYLAIFTDQAISIKVNGGAALDLTPTVAGTKTFVYYAKTEITALTVSNSSGSTANIDVVAVKI